MPTPIGKTASVSRRKAQVCQAVISGILDSGSTVGARHPEYIVLALVVGPAAGNKQEVR